jgi:hypothetical protein
VDQTATTGVSVSISGSSASDGTPVSITSTDYGSANPGVGAVSLGYAVYYDVRVQGISDGMATITFTGISNQMLMLYWNGAQWVLASDITSLGDTITGTIPVSALTGTPIAVGTLKSSTTELTLSATSLSIIIVMIVAVVIILCMLFVYMKKRKAK